MAKVENFVIIQWEIVGQSSGSKWEWKNSSEYCAIFLLTLNQNKPQNWNGRDLRGQRAREKKMGKKRKMGPGEQIFI